MNVLPLGELKCLLDANWSWQFCSLKKEKRKNRKTKGKIFASCRASWIWVSGESLQWLKLPWYWPKAGGVYQKRFRFLLSIWETTPGAPEPLLGSQHKKEGIGKLAQVPYNWRKASKTTMGLQHPALKEWGRCHAHSASQRKQAGWVKTANIHSGYPFIQRGIQPWTKYMLLQDAQQKDNSDNQKKNKK